MLRFRNEVIVVSVNIILIFERRSRKNEYI